MLLVKNNLKKKRTIDDASPEARVLRDDANEYLNYLKFSHLQPSNKPKSFDIETSIASPEARVLRVKATQTINTADKGVDTGNDFDEVIPPYASLMYSEDFDRNEKMVQVWTKMFKQNLTPPPSSSSSSSSSSNNGHGFMSKTARRGFRLAEFALNTAITGANLTMAVSDALVDLTSAPHQSSEEEQPINNPEVISVNSSPPETINSSSSGVEVVPPVIEISSSGSGSRNSPAPSSIPAPTSPQPSSPASSAKTTPRKKSK